MTDQLTAQRLTGPQRQQNIPPQIEPKVKDVTIKVSKIGNGYQVTELATGVPYAYFDLGLLPPSDDSLPAVTVAEHLARFFKKLEDTFGI